MLSYTQIYKALILVVLAMNSNQIRVYLEVDPAMAPLGYSTAQAGFYAIFLGFFMANTLLALRETGKFALVNLSACLLVVLYYPASLLYYAIVAGLISKIPMFLISFTILTVFALVMGLILQKKESEWLIVSRIAKWDYAVAAFLLLSLPTIWLSGLFGEHEVAFINYYATFLYIVFAVMLVSIWQPKALRLLPHLVILWSILFSFLIVLFGYWQTGYLLTVALHVICSIAYLYFMLKKRQALYS